MEQMPDRTESALNITLIANAGLLLRWRNTVILLDALFQKKGHPFSAPSAEMFQRMENAQFPFEQIDYLLFSHVHPDHFSPEITLRFLRHRSIRGMIFPQDVLITRSGLENFLKEQKIPAIALTEQIHHALFHPVPGLTVEALKTPHLDEQFRNVPHYCYIISFGKKRILFTADVDYTQETFETLSDILFDAVFVNPLFFCALRRPKFFRGSLNAKQVCVYHIPFPENDFTGIRSALERELRNWTDIQPILLWNAFQSVTL